MSLKPEQIDHINLVNWFNHTYPELAEDFHHFANERKCSVQQGRLLKRMGVKKGVSDFFLAVPVGAYHGLWIELKVGKGKLSKEQVDFLDRKASKGYAAVCALGFNAASEIIKGYLRRLYSNSLSNKPKNLYDSKPIC